MVVVYKLRGYDILKDGHTMFKEDIVRDLNRLAYLEEQRRNSLNQTPGEDSGEIARLKKELEDLKKETNCVPLTLVDPSNAF